MNFNPQLVAAPFVALACLAGAANAQEWRGPHGQEVVIPHDAMHYDDRYQHNHYYPPRGYAVPVLPRGAVTVAYGAGTYYYHGGVWFQPAGGRYVVAMPPPGIVVPMLPPSYVTLAFGGVPTYYANGIYYVAAPGQGYAVIAPPPGAAMDAPVVAMAAQAPPVREPVTYPRNGQAPAQMAVDREECDAWAITQPNPAADPHVVRHAFKTCMNGRGYSLR